MRKFIAVLLFCGSLAATAQQPTTPLTQVPPKPSCVVILRNGSCADLWNAYNTALAQRQREEIQMYVNRQKELASAAATAPLEQQIADLNKLSADQQTQLKKLQEQMQTDATAALEAKTASHAEGMQKGIMYGAGGMLLMVIVILGIRRMSRNFAVVKKSQAASAN
jgi:hypothetical protein